MAVPAGRPTRQALRPQLHSLFKRALNPERSAGLPQLSAGRTPGLFPYVAIVVVQAAPRQGVAWGFSKLCSLAI